MCKQKFFICKQCKNLVSIINDSGLPLSCCGEEMHEIVPNTTDAAAEKHVPQVTVTGDCVTVQVGSKEHPMTEEHHIDFIYLKTVNGGQRKCLKVGNEPKAEFVLKDDTALEAFAYCNLHGLWKVVIASVS